MQRVKPPPLTGLELNGGNELFSVAEESPSMVDRASALPSL